MWAFRFGAVHTHSHIKQGHHSQFKKIILSETPCILTCAYAYGEGEGRKGGLQGLL